MIEAGKVFILVDPILGKVSSLPPFTQMRFKHIPNSTAPLPANYEAILKKVTHCVLTHPHPDHFDADGEEFLKSRNITITCSIYDEKFIKDKKLNVKQVLKP